MKLTDKYGWLNGILYLLTSFLSGFVEVVISVSITFILGTILAVYTLLTHTEVGDNLASGPINGIYAIIHVGLSPLIAIVALISGAITFYLLIKRFKQYSKNFLFLLVIALGLLLMDRFIKTLGFFSRHAKQL